MVNWGREGAEREGWRTDDPCGEVKLKRGIVFLQLFFFFKKIFLIFLIFLKYLLGEATSIPKEKKKFTQ